MNHRLGQPDPFFDLTRRKQTPAQVQAFQFFFCSCRLADRIPETFENLPCFVFVKLNQDVIFVLEIEIDGAIRHTGFFGNLGNGGLKETVLGEYLDCRFEYAMVFIVFPAFFIDVAPPRAWILVL